MTLEMERRPPCITTWAAISSFTLIREPMILEERERAREREGEGGRGEGEGREGEGRESEGERGRERVSEEERGRGEGEGGREREGEGGRERERGEGEGRREVLEKLLWNRFTCSNGCVYSRESVLCEGGTLVGLHCLGEVEHTLVTQERPRKRQTWRQ